MLVLINFSDINGHVVLCCVSHMVVELEVEQFFIFYFLFNNNKTVDHIYKIFP